MQSVLDKQIVSIVDEVENFSNKQGLVLELTYNISNDLLKIISNRSKELPSLYFVEVEMLKKRLENGCFLIKKDNVIVGHIFAHKHVVESHFVYERSSLWVHPDYRNSNLGLLLMYNMTKLYTNDFLISIAQTPKVHHYNELIGMEHVTLANMSNVLVTELEKIGKLRDELKFKYYVNSFFKSQIKELK